MAEADGFDDVFYTASDGLKLHARVYGDGHFGSWPVVCLPGLTRNARDFHELALFLSTHRKDPAKGGRLRLSRARPVRPRPKLEELYARHRDGRHRRRADRARHRACGLHRHVARRTHPAHDDIGTSGGDQGRGAERHRAGRRRRRTGAYPCLSGSGRRSRHPWPTRSPSSVRRTARHFRR